MSTILKFSSMLTILFLFIIDDGIMSMTNEKLSCIPKWFHKRHSFVCVCNATHCDSFDDDDKISKKSKIITMFTSDSHSDRFVRSEHSFENVNTLRAGQTIKINHNKTYQTIIGFGAAFTDATGVNLGKLNEKLAENVLYDYFSSRGLRYSMGRVPIGGTDFSTRPYSYDELGPKIHEDFNLTYFKLANEDFKYKIPMVKLAQNISHYPIKLFASPWSPPAWLKTNDHLNGLGRIKGKPDGIYYETYAVYLIKFLREYQKQGIDFWGMTIQNEPIDGTIPKFKFNCNAMSPEEQRDFISETLGPLLSASGFGIDKLKLIIMDDQRPFIEKWANVILADERANKYVSGIGFHWYMNSFTSPDVVTKTHQKFPNYFLLSTEACEGSSPFELEKVSFGNWDRAQSYAYDIIQDLNHYTNGWIDWNMALDHEGGPNWVKNFVDSPIIVSEDGSEYYKQPMYYSLAHFTRFIEPGSKRLDIEIQHEYLNMVAFETPNNATVLIVMNRNNHQVPLKIHDDKYGIFSHEIKAHSINTLVWY